VSLAQSHDILCQPGGPFEIGEAVVDGRTVRTWANAPPTLRQVFLLSRMYGPRDFLVHEEERTSFDGFARATLALAEALQADGVKPGDRVAIAMRNLPEWPVAYFATVLVGGIAVPLNAWWTGAELQYGLRDSGASVLLADAERFERVGGRLGDCPELRTTWVSRSGGAAAGARRLEAVIGAVGDWAVVDERPMPKVELTPETDTAIFYTSGTTGRPKGALGTHRNAVGSLVAGMFSLARAYVRRGETPPTPDPGGPQKAILLSIPLFHTTGCNVGLMQAVAGGAKLVMQRRFDAEDAFRLIERERITNAGGVPAVAVQLLEHPARGRFDLSSLEGISYGGAPAPPALVRRLREAFPDALPGSGWGMTETSATHTHHMGEDYVNRPDSCGPVTPVSALKVVGPDGAELPTGEVGELMAYGPNIVRGYWNNPEATAETFVDGWVRTGDLGRLDEEGFCLIVDRAKDVIIRGGENIASVEVETALYEHPAVIDAAVVARAHPVLGEEPVAVVTLRRGETVGEDALRDHVRARLAGFKVPAAIRFRPEALPRNASGKILKSELKKLFVEPAS